MPDILYSTDHARVVTLSRSKSDMTHVDARFTEDFVKIVRFSDLDENHWFTLWPEEVEAFLQAWQSWQSHLAEKYQ
ncbi:MAG: hypothetical protein JO202_02920 [Ktedonobacteraceae bacterium]|nr:hypothetical protein [Ktedonobacteraceae bacterium]